MGIIAALTSGMKQTLTKQDLNSAIQLYDKIMAHEVSADTVCSEIILETVQQSSNGIGNWHLHFKSLQEMLPYFAAAGHNLLYTKSVHMYLQQILKLQAQHPDVYASALDIM